MNLNITIALSRLFKMDTFVYCYIFYLFDLKKLLDYDFVLLKPLAGQRIED